ncbi:unnamed protein product [Protopolystoma xenopodis]|uniref:Uncharacterized protein n=1 Tax=Protopolystoma xenopodis TaxID=117903 RepID=A0A448WC38_9PLAT|nr:unnamed protein product [Protopolystoma xenopodis]
MHGWVQGNGCEGQRMGGKPGSRAWVEGSGPKGDGQIEQEIRLRCTCGHAVQLCSAKLCQTRVRISPTETCSPPCLPCGPPRSDPFGPHSYLCHTGRPNLVYEARPAWLSISSQTREAIFTLLRTRKVALLNCPPREPPPPLYSVIWVRPWQSVSP